MKPDFHVKNEGSIFLFTPLTKEAQEFSVEAFADAMTWGASSYVVEHRYAHNIALDLQEKGFVLK